MNGIGAVSEEVANGQSPTFRTICRSMAINPEGGSFYFSTWDGVIHRYLGETGQVEVVAGVDLKKDYFELYDPSS